MKLKSILLVLILCGFCQNIISQKLTIKGKEFFVSFFKNYLPASDSEFLLITSQVNTFGNISNPNTGYNQPFTVTAGNVAKINIPLAQADNQIPGINNLGLIVRSDDSIALYALNTQAYSSDAATIIPAPYLGTDYVAASYFTRSPTTPTCVLIEATQDNTNIQITPSIYTSDNHLPNIPFSITLNRGQTYYLTQNQNNPNADISGTLINVINGCNPIAVFSGSSAPEIPPNGGTTDICYEQLFPVSSFGRQFITANFRGRNMYIARVFAAFDSTDIFIDGVPAATINKTKYYEFQSLNQPKYITTSKPSEVMMYAPNIVLDGQNGPKNYGDPTMMTVPPLEQQLTASLFLSPPMGAINAHKTSIVCKTADAFNTTLDGVNVGSSFAIVPGNPVYCYASFDISAGQHNILNSRGFIAYAYGFGFVQGYGYFTGAAAENISTYFTLNQTASIKHPTIDACPGVDSFKIITADSNINYRWDFGDGSPIINTDGTVLLQTHNYTTSGTYKVTLINTKGSVNNNCNIFNNDTSFLYVKISNTLTPSVKITSSPTNPICQNSSNIIFVATPVNEGIAPIFQWKKNGVVVGFNSPLLTLPTVAANDQISCTLTSSIPCATTPTATDNLVVQMSQPVAPTVSITSSADTICAHTQILFSASPGSNYQNIVYQWQVNEINVGVNSDTYNYSPVNGDRVTCIITVSSNCIAPNTATSNMKTIKVFPATNVAAVQINAAQNPVCSNTANTFTAVPSPAGINPSYQWKLNGNTVGTNSPAYSVNSSQNGDSISCLMTISSNLVCNKFANSNVIKMQVNPMLTPSVTIQVSKNNICPGDSVAFTAIPVNGGTAPVYQWQVNGNNVGSNANIFSSKTLANNDVVTCAMTSNENCLTASSAVVSNSITMVINSNAAPGISIAASKTNICQGDAVTFTASPLNSNNSTSYQWKLNGNNVGVNTLTYINGNLQNNDTIYCIMSSISACNFNSNIISNKIIMRVDTVVTPSISIVSQKNNLCAGDNVLFSATPINPGTFPKYQWQLNGINVGSNSINYSNNGLANGDFVKMYMVINTACATTDTAFSNQINLIVNPVVTPTINISALKNPICQGDSVTLIAVITNGGTHPVYTWNKNGNNLNNNKSSYTSKNFADADQITCSLNSNMTCALPAISSVIVMKVLPAPTVSFNPSEIVLPYNKTFQMQPIVTGNIINYLWTPSTNLDNSNILNPVVTGLESQLYLLTVTNTDHCVASAKINIMVFKDFFMPNAFMPAGKNNVFIIPQMYQSLKIYFFRIFNRYGQIIFETSNTSSGWDGTLNGIPQPMGSYVWMIQYENPLTQKTTLAHGDFILIR